MTHVHLSDEAKIFLSPVGSNTHGLLLQQQLAEMIPPADDIDVTLEDVNVGGTIFACVVFLLKKANMNDITVLIQQHDVICLHPQTLEPLFRGERMIKEVMHPKIRESWGIDI